MQLLKLIKNIFTDPQYHIYAISIWCLLITAATIVFPHPLSIIGPAILPIGLFYLLKLPFVVCLIFILFSFFRLHEVFHQLDPIKIPLLTALGSYFVLFWHIILTRKVKPYWRQEHRSFGLFFVWVVVGIIFSSFPPAAFGSFTSVYMKIGIMVIAISWLMTQRWHFKLAHFSLLIAGLAVAGVTLFNKANGIGMVEETRVTIPNTSLGDPNDLSLVLSFPMSFAIAFIVTKDTGKIRTLLGIIAFFTLVSAIIATQSRGGLLATLAVLGIFGLRVIKSKLVLISLGCFCMVILVFAAGINDRKSGGAEEEGIDASAMGRIHAWEAAFNMGIRNPMTGVGLSLFLDNYWTYATHSRAEGQAHVTHSTWFQVLAETGFVGFFLFINLLVQTFRSVYRSVSWLDDLQGKPDEDPHIRAAAAGTLAGLVGFCVSGTFLSQGFLWPVYIIVSISISLANYLDIKQQEMKQKDTTDESPAIVNRNKDNPERNGTAYVSSTQTMAQDR